MFSKKKKAFTLTELLVVVIVIGILAAVVLPKFSKVVETRKTTEAEELMAAVRTEQERRCALDEKYLVNLSQLATVLPSSETKNFSFRVTNTGIEAQSKGKYGYTLKMPSYRDGRVCCDSAEQCAKLNKDYPLCSELIAYADYQSGAECAGEAEEKTCSGASVQSCGCQGKGEQTRTCNTTTGQWSEWSACNIPDECECTDPQPASSQTCNSCGTQTRTVTCNTATGQWDTSAWGACSKTLAECQAGSGDREDICDVDLSRYSNRWEYCCQNKTTADAACYRTCSITQKTPSYGSFGQEYIWASTGKTCSSGGAISGAANAISCTGMTCSARVEGTSCCQNNQLNVCVQKNMTEGGAVAITKVYYCAIYDNCSPSCDGYKEFSSSSSGSGSGSSGGSSSGGSSSEGGWNSGNWSGSGSGSHTGGSLPSGGGSTGRPGINRPGGSTGGIRFP